MAKSDYGVRASSGGVPSGITREEENLRWKYAKGEITLVEFWQQYKRLLEDGKIQRSGKVIKDGGNSSV